MKFGVREICDVVFKAKANVKIGNTEFKKGQPVLYIDTAKTSTVEGAATTVYATGGKGNTRLIAWEGEKTLTFTVEDALLSPVGFAILSGAGLFKDESEDVHVHSTALAYVDNSGVIGFFIYGTEDKEILDNTHCFFKSFDIYNSKYITFEGIDRKYEAEIFDENGNIIMRTDDTRYLHCISRSNKQILFNTTSSPMPIKNATFRIFPKNKYQETTAQFNLGEEVFGGDGFSLERDIRLYIDGVELKATELYDLGTFYRGSYFIKLDVNNNEDYILNNITLKVLKYSEYYGGEEEIALALHHEGSSESELVYSKQVTIPEIKPSESKSIFMKLMDKPTQGLFDTGNAYRFKILIE